ncbi:MAG: TadE/TadG family type IV pilus assembly protein, partial [Ktedonobacterales bacterium]
MLRRDDAGDAGDAGRRAQQQRRGRSRGQALVEFALISPIFFLMIFGVIEFSVINASIGVYNFAAKDAARIGSIHGPTDAQSDQEMVRLILSRVSGLGAAHILKIEIYRSNETGGYDPAHDDAYDGQGNPIGVATWPYSARSDSGAFDEYLGVRITYQYIYLTAFFSSAG